MDNAQNNLFNGIIKKIKYRFNLDEDKAAEVDVIDNIKKSVEFKGINIWTLIFATFVASIGLNVNSTAVIIGAMLISPLMGPIMGIGLGAGIFDFKLIKLSLKNLLISSVIALITSTIYFWISPLNQAQSELLARTSPTIYDVLIALFGGLAGIVASSRTKYNNVIPGVAIATALMPPLCTAGFGLATLQFSYFFGALYLFVINSVFISISTFLIVRYLKFKPTIEVDAKTNARIKKWIGFIAIGTIIPSIFLAYQFINNEFFIQNSHNLINEEINNSGLSIINQKIDPSTKTIRVAVLNCNNIDSLNHILVIKKDKYKLTDAQIIISDGSGSKAINVASLKNEIVADLFDKQEQTINEKNQEINTLKATLLEQEKINAKKTETINEFRALFGETDEILIDKTTINYMDSIEPILILYVKSKKINDKSTEIPKIESWLQTKFKTNRVKIIVN